jgi:transposase
MTKVVNYTPEQETQLVDQYQAGMSKEEIAAMLGKSVRSVVAKLSRLGLYQAQVAKPGTTKAAKVVKVSKAQLVAIIEARYGKEPGTFAELEKLTKATLTTLACED